MTTNIPLSNFLRLAPAQRQNPVGPRYEYLAVAPDPWAQTKHVQTAGSAKTDSNQTSAVFLKDELRHAWRTKAFDVVYQPQVNLITQHVIAFEAIVRWLHPVRGLIAQSEFIAAAEALGILGDIGQWIMNQTCRIAATWPSRIGLAVNVFSMQLQDPAFPGMVAKALHSSGLDASRLELEVTETALMSDDPTSLRVLHTIRKSGVQITMDAFDTGYSGMSHLVRFPYDKIKLDRYFINQLFHDVNHHSTVRSIVRALIALCDDLNIVFVAEGVETAEQLSILMMENCTTIQGCFVGEPKPAHFVADTIVSMTERLQGLQTVKQPYQKISFEGTGDNISFMQIAETSRDTILITSAQMAPPGPVIVYVNPAFTKMTGYGLAEMVGKSPRMLHGAATNPTILTRIRRHLESGLLVQEQLVNYTKSGVPYVIDLTIVGLHNTKGKITHFAATGRSVTLVNETPSLSPADCDPLTGLDTEDQFSSHLTRVIAESHHSTDAVPSVTIYLILIDIDAFHLLQKTMNPEVSDCVVRGVAHCLAENIRRSDRLGRLDDATFAIYLPASTLADAKSLAEGLRKAVAQARLATPLGLMNVTISLGLDGFRLGDSVATLTLRAATALSAAQRAGQNRVRVFAVPRRTTSAASPQKAFRQSGPR